MISVRHLSWWMMQQNYHLKKQTPSMSRDFPRVASENRRWLFDKLLFHTDLAFAERQNRHSSSSTSKNI
ncbi:hypothetical protein AMECASPLE_014221 [Ameca splendens]|uniref:Uncharacterized protein n=1 Tax=Ameca splendens TaxID=208324 RepID=A0ABV0ZCB3_9TELE